MLYFVLYIRETTDYRSAERATPPGNSQAEGPKNILNLERDLDLAEGANLSGKQTEGIKKDLI